MTKKTQDQYDALISFMQDGYEYPLSDLSEVLGVKETRTKQIIKELIEQNLIISTDSNKGRKYKKV